MDLNEIKSLLGNGGGKIVIVEDGKPTLVILSYEEYKGGNVASLVANAKEELTVDDLPL